MPNEMTVNYEEILQENDPALNPANRPPINDAINMILGSAHGYEVPFAAVPLSQHQGMPAQNLYNCLFGRDSLIISDLLFAVKPHLRLNVISALALNQGKVFDADSEEEPGRIAHEVRSADDPVAHKLTAEGAWKFPYFGSVDATLIWMNQVQQAAKADSYMHANGVLARGDSTASVETVGETFDAIIAAVAIQEMKPSGKWPLSSREMLKIARNLQLSLVGTFWLGDSFALGIERDSNGNTAKFESMASNQGRLLDSGVLLGDEFSGYRTAIANAMTDESMLGESGLRTLSSAHHSYRPGGYHTGSSWPFDGVLTARGLLKNGFTRESKMVQAKIKNAIESCGGYPEFFRGDWPETDLINRFIHDVQIVDERGVHSHTNRVAQPPQIIQGWTVAAYSWLADKA